MYLRIILFVIVYTITYLEKHSFQRSKPQHEGRHVENQNHVENIPRTLTTKVPG
jgi:hypothetical protein